MAIILFPTMISIIVTVIFGLILAMNEHIEINNKTYDIAISVVFTVVFWISIIVLKIWYIK